MWISLSLFSLRFTQFLESVTLHLLWNLESFQPLYLQILFQSDILFSPPQIFNDSNVRSLVIVPEVSEALLTFSCFFLLFTWSKRYFFLQVHDAIICPVHSTAAAKSLQSCPTLCDPLDGSPPGSPIPRILQARTVGVGCHFLLQCMKVKSEREVAQLCPTLRDPMDCSLPGSSIHGIF